MKVYEVEDFSLGEKDVVVLLGRSVEQLELLRRADVLIDDIDPGFGVLLPDVTDLFQGNAATHG